jgi:hydrogenase expression/formation protein HypC
MCLGIPGRVDKIEGQNATVEFGGAARTVSLELVPEEVRVGDYVLVHAGFALERIDEDEARETLQLLKEAVGLEIPE